MGARSLALNFPLFLKDFHRENFKFNKKNRSLYTPPGCDLQPPCVQFIHNPFFAMHKFLHCHSQTNAKKWEATSQKIKPYFEQFLQFFGSFFSFGSGGGQGLYVSNDFLVSGRRPEIPLSTLGSDTIIIVGDCPRIFRRCWYSRPAQRKKKSKPPSRAALHERSKKTIPRMYGPSPNGTFLQKLRHKINWKIATYNHLCSQSSLFCCCCCCCCFLLVLLFSTCCFV